MVVAWKNNCGKIKRNTYINILSVIIIVVVVVMVNVNSARGSSVVVVRCTHSFWRKHSKCNFMMASGYYYYSFDTKCICVVLEYAIHQNVMNMHSLVYYKIFRNIPRWTVLCTRVGRRYLNRYYCFASFHFLLEIMAWRYNDIVCYPRWSLICCWCCCCCCYTCSKHWHLYS